MILGWVTLDIGTLEGDKSGILHILDKTNLLASTAPIQIPTSIHIYSGGSAYLPTNVTVGSPYAPFYCFFFVTLFFRIFGTNFYIYSMIFTSRGVITGLQNMVVENGGFLVLGKELYRWESVQISGSTSLV